MKGSFGHQGYIVGKIAPQMAREDSCLNIRQLRDPQRLIQQRMIQRLLLAFLIRLDDKSATGVGELNCTAFAFFKMFRSDLLPVDQCDSQPVGQPRAELLHEIQGE